MSKYVRDYMATDPVTLDQKSTLLDAARLMRERNIGDVIVTENGRARGIVTDRDIVVRGLAADKDPAMEQLGSICSRNLVTVYPDQTIGEATKLMRKHAVRRIPVLKEEKPVGVLSLGDVAVALEPGSPLGELSSAPPTN